MDYLRQNYLAHWGIKGQRWGIRRFQNPDGSLTEAGKKRYSVSSEEKKEIINSGDINKVKGIRHQLDNNELQYAVNRINLEKRLDQLDRESKERNHKKTKTVMQRVNSTTKTLGGITAFYLAGKKAYDTYGKDVIRNVSGTETARELQKAAMYMSEGFMQSLKNGALAADLYLHRR